MVEKLAENGAFFEGQKRHLPCLEPGYWTQAIDLATFMSADFLAAESRKNVGAPFWGEGLFST